MRKVNELEKIRDSPKNEVQRVLAFDTHDVQTVLEVDNQKKKEKKHAAVRVSFIYSFGGFPCVAGYKRAYCQTASPHMRVCPQALSRQCAKN